MMNFVVVAVFVVFGAGVCVSDQLPEKWVTCPMGANHNECIKGAIQSAVKSLKKGDRKLGTPSFSPLHIDSLKVSQGKGPLKMKLELKNYDLYGMDDMVLTSVKNDWKKMELTMTAPKLIGKGNYKVDGQVLVLPISGEGPCELISKDVKINAILTFSVKTHKGKEYYNLDSVHSNITAEGFHTQMDNLFGGNKQLGDQMNQFLNEHWKEIYYEFVPVFSSAVDQASQEIANRIFSKIPKDQITPK